MAMNWILKNPRLGTGGPQRPGTHPTCAGPSKSRDPAHVGRVPTLSKHRVPPILKNPINWHYFILLWAFLELGGPSTWGLADFSFGSLSPLAVPMNNWFDVRRVPSSRSPVMATILKNPIH